jgi:hypothetical protein
MGHHKKAAKQVVNQINQKVNQPREDAPSEFGVGEPASVDNSNFKSELQYDGYRDIEDYDNEVLGANPDAEQYPDRELNIVEREEPNVPLGSQASEEDLLDPQGNREAS